MTATAKRARSAGVIRSTDSLTLVLPMQLQSGVNATASMNRWRKGDAVEQDKAPVLLAMAGERITRKVASVLFAYYVPIRNRVKDSDNLVGKFKAVRDAVAESLGVSDADLMPNYTGPEWRTPMQFVADDFMVTITLFYAGES